MPLLFLVNEVHLNVQMLLSLLFLFQLQVYPINAINELGRPVKRFYKNPVEKNFLKPSLQSEVLRDRLSIYFPETEGNYPVVFFVHGWGCNKRNIASMARFVASNGFITVAISVKERRYPENWLPALQSAIQLVKDECTQSESPLYNKADFSRMGLVGHSMGGAAVLHYANRHREIDAVIALHPYNGGKGIVSWVGGENNTLTDKLYNQTASTLILSGTDDIVALPEKTYMFFEGLTCASPDTYSSGDENPSFANDRPYMLVEALTVASGVKKAIKQTKTLSIPDIEHSFDEGTFPLCLFLLLDGCNHIYPTELEYQYFTQKYKSAYLVYQLLVVSYLQASLNNDEQSKALFTPGTTDFEMLKTILAPLDKKGVPAFDAKTAKTR